jgi:hypothetical protein
MRFNKVLCASTAARNSASRAASERRVAARAGDAPRRVASRSRVGHRSPIRIRVKRLVKTI